MKLYKHQRYFILIFVLSLYVFSLPFIALKPPVNDVKVEKKDGSLASQNLSAVVSSSKQYQNASNSFNTTAVFASHHENEKLRNNSVVSTPPPPSAGQNVVTASHNIRNDTKLLERASNRIRLSPFSRIVLMGQFNFDGLSVNTIATWVRKIKSVGFHQVLVRGACFDQTWVHKLQSAGIAAKSTPRCTKHDRGYFSPYLNLKDALLEWSQANNSSRDEVDGILYIHDDALVNLTVLQRVLSSTQSMAIIGTNRGLEDLMASNMDVSYEDPRDTPQNDTTDPMEVKLWNEKMSRTSFRVYPRNNTAPYANFDGTKMYKYVPSLEKDNNLFPWVPRRSNFCSRGLLRFSKNPMAAPYLEWDEDGKPFLLMPQHTQSDFLYVPLSYAKPFANLVSLFAKAGVWLECTIPVIVDQLRRLHGAAVSVIPLCSNWDKNIRGTMAMLDYCKGAERRLNVSFGVYHPVKIRQAIQTSKNTSGDEHNSTLSNKTSSITFWEAAFDEMNREWVTSPPS